MHKEQVYRKYSDEFKEVINTFPKRTNNRLLFFLISLITFGLFLGWIIKSPDVILAEVKVTAKKPPINIVSRISGKIKLKINSFGELVHKNDYIALLENSANEEHIFKLKEALQSFSFDTIPNFNEFSFALKYQLGEIQSKYFEFIKTLYEVNQLNTLNKYELEKYSLNNQISSIKKSIEKRKEILNFKHENIILFSKNVSEDSILVKVGAIPRIEFEKNKSRLIKEKEYSIVEENQIIKDQLSILDLNNKLSKIQYEKVEVIDKLNVKLLTDYQELINAIHLWEQSYVFISPIDGKLENLKFLGNNQFIEKGEALFSVLPSDNEIIGQAFLPSEGAGKVRVGQKVKIKLDSYPFQEYGIIEGEIDKISLIPLEKIYLVRIKLSNGLISDNGLELNFSKEMSGQAEIITQKRRLLARLFEKFKYLLEKKRNNNIINKKNDKETNEK
ncbi:HlyD family efflux transporter periplasmic adaptor subunit [Tenacibaculum sp. TC6]|uniref:HlyD family efflux transporter periplasmic adaptor subunit n=1 Tax=Tenacibaculum sp. TC6 TaxID=3423223 RepID=UPI003D36AFBD